MMKYYTLLSSCLWCGIILLAGCKQQTESRETFACRIEGDMVLVSGSSWTDELKISEVQQVSYSKEIIAAGTVRPIPTQYTNIAPPFAGRVVKSYVKMGQSVKEGQPLFAITCPEFTAAQKEIGRAHV